MALDWFVNHYGDWAKWKGALQRLASWRLAVDEHQRNRQVELIVDSHQFRLEGLSLRGPIGSEGGQWLRDYPDLIVRKGEVVAIRGPSGYGKSTLFAAAAGVWPWGTGKICIPSDCVFVPQSAYFPAGDLKSAICYPYPVDPEKLAHGRDLMARLGLQSYIDRLQEEADWNSQLSGGEAARFALVRALVSRPKWLFLDEPTAHLDSRSASLYWGLLAKQHDLTLIVITHRELPEVVAIREVNLAEFAH